MNPLVRMALSPVAGFGAYQVVRFASEGAALAAGAILMLGLALLPGSGVKA